MQSWMHVGGYAQNAQLGAVRIATTTQATVYFWDNGHWRFLLTGRIASDLVEQFMQALNKGAEGQLKIEYPNGTSKIYPL
jgi:hypothetical protein